MRKIEKVKAFAFRNNEHKVPTWKAIFVVYLAISTLSVISALAY